MSEADPLQTDPKTAGSADGRDSAGRFRKGCAPGPGNPGIGQLAAHRARFAAALKSRDIDAALKVIRDVMKKGKDADRLAAARELLNRVLGLPAPGDVLERIEKLESLMAANNGQNGEHNGQH
jgi:hypothetical protein